MKRNLLTLATIALILTLGACSTTLRTGGGGHRRHAVGHGHAHNHSCGHVWDGHVWIVVKKNHVHRNGCGHHHRNGRWCNTVLRVR